MTHTALERPIDGLSATPPAALPFGRNIQARSFLLERPQGNLIVYNAPGLTPTADAIREAGGADRLYINHGHEGMFGPQDVEAPMYVHEADRDEAAQSLTIAGTFSERETIGDFEVIPTPGHTPGTTCFLWDNGTHRFLFTGDMLSVTDGEWEIVLLGSSDRATYIESLKLIRELDFDVLVPWVCTEGEPVVDVVTQARAHEQLDAIIARVEAGSNH